ncbi:outer membrane beta-barrel protein [Methylosinus sp. H3A]|uniref:outer membrane beta-barrel protein n=1 Tax=Methylosinus sp. H3A TaxID=2785786 RepID=UPI0018C1F2B4|nr:outer membrane beta-barrel protein [Methylosinus sp. H3A]MBG0811627.1 outer membrane beta-barrel protein [Methylosinus sp. H3A]
MVESRLAACVVAATLAVTPVFAEDDDDRALLGWPTPPAASSARSSSRSGADEKSEKKKPPPAWLDSLTVNGFVNAGSTFNFDNPFNKLNWGHLFTDRANQPQFNAGVMTMQRLPDPKATKDFDFGFKIQGMVGSDARYTHFLGELDYAMRDRTQLDILQAFATAHLPWIIDNGFDVRIGQFVTLEGAELVDSLFYSHSYIFNFGIPLKQTGVMLSADLSSWLYVHASVMSGDSASLGWPGDNNNAASFQGGMRIKAFDGKLTILGTTHIGPEDPKQLDPLGVGWPNIPYECACDPNRALSYSNDVTLTWKATDKLTLSMDINYVRDDGWNALSITGLSDGVLNRLADLYGFDAALVPRRARGVNGYGIAQYASYKIDDVFQLNGRVEFWRDHNNYFVGAYPGYFDYMNIDHGFYAPSAIFQPEGRGTSYLELTAGLTITPQIPKGLPITGLTLRPELRFDASLTGAAPFFGASGVRRSTGMFAVDVIVPFALK